jgi:hypothetical protein
MSNGPRCKTNQRLRILLDAELKTIPTDKNFTVGEMAERLTCRRTPVCGRNAGRLLMERDDVVHVKDGVWKRVVI